MIYKMNAKGVSFECFGRQGKYLEGLPGLKWIGVANIKKAREVWRSNLHYHKAFEIHFLEKGKLRLTCPRSLYHLQS